MKKETVTLILSGLDLRIYISTCNLISMFYSPGHSSACILGGLLSTSSTRGDSSSNPMLHGTKASPAGCKNAPSACAPSSCPHLYLLLRISISYPRMTLKSYVSPSVLCMPGKRAFKNRNHIFSISDVHKDALLQIFFTVCHL